MRTPALALALTSAALLAACTASDVRQDYLPATVSPDIDRARQLPPAGRDDATVMEQAPNGTSFGAFLARDYKSLMLFEADRMNDYVSADMYARRSLAAARGATVEPLPLDSFDLPPEPLPSLRQGRSDLLELFGMGARAQFPEQAARAQSRFDCWVEQQEENHQPDHIARCRDEFIAALNELKAKMAPSPRAQPTQPAVTTAPGPTFEDSYTVYFNFDSTALDDRGRATLAEVVRALQAQNAGASIIGHTDTAGPVAYNKALSERRSRAVADVLLQAGVRPAVVTTEGRGETELARPTGDNVRNEANRRAVVNIR